MKIADLVDLEWLLRDGARVPDEVVAAAREAVPAVCAARGIAPEEARASLDVDRGLREGLAHAVLAAARAREASLPGRGVARALELAALAFAVLGALLGFGAASAVLAYDGKTPVNVVHFALVFFALQVLLLLALAWWLARARRADTGPALPHRALAWAAERLNGRRGAAVAELLTALRARRSLYATAEKWTLFALAQRFGVMFNVAALATTLVLVTGTDLVFSWSTTLAVGPEAAHAIARWVALPWLWLPEAVPTYDVVRMSQWVRMPGTFVSGESLDVVQPLAAQWWKYLVAGLVAYGLLPRLFALALGGWRRSRALARASLDHAGFHALFDRVLPAAAAWRGPSPDAVRGEPPRKGPAPATPHAPRSPGASALLLCWGNLAAQADAVRDLAARRFGVHVQATAAAGGKALDGDAAALRAIENGKPSRLVVAVAAGQQPTGDVLAFLRSARKALGAGKPIVLLLADVANGAVRAAEPVEHAIWKRSLGSLGDPHLWLEGVEVPA